MRLKVPAVRRHVGAGVPTEQILKFAEERQIELLVCGSIYRNAFVRLFVGATVEVLVNTAPCDLLLVKPRDFLSQLARQLDFGGLCSAHGVELNAALRDT